MHYTRAVNGARWTTLSIRDQIIVFLLLCFLILSSVVGMGLYNLRSTVYTIDRIRLANQQLVAMTTLAVASNRQQGGRIEVESAVGRGTETCAASCETRVTTPSS
jgi:hypothetical protein